MPPRRYLGLLAVCVGGIHNPYMGAVSETPSLTTLMRSDLGSHMHFHAWRYPSVLHSTGIAGMNCGKGSEGQSYPLLCWLPASSVYP